MALKLGMKLTLVAYSANITFVENQVNAWFLICSQKWQTKTLKRLKTMDNLSQEQPTDGELPPSPDPKTEGVLGEVPNSTGVLSFYSYPVFVGEGGTHSEAMMG